ncbi:MAG: hypothetical protein U9R32_07355, partial [Bacteroidota bacterium]|nr:hypothetical protein [Bacteroidota bacterium]
NEDGKEALHNYTEIIKPKKVKPKSFIAEKELIENPIDFNTKSLKELKKQIKDMGLKEIPNNRIQAFNIALTKIFNNHRESRRKLSNKEFDSQYDWNTTISDWIGRDNAINLYRKLTGKNDV